MGVFCPGSRWILSRGLFSYGGFCPGGFCPGGFCFRNDVTVTLFLNQSLQNFKVFLEIISSTFVQDFSKKKCFTLPLQHILLRVLRQNQVIDISDDAAVTSFFNQSQQHLYFRL